MCVCVCVCFCERRRHVEGRNIVKVHKAVNKHWCLNAFACRDTCCVMLCEVWRAGRTDSAKERTAVQLQQREWDKWQGCQLDNQCSGSMASVIEVFEKEKVKNKQHSCRIFTLCFPKTAPHFFICLSSFARDTLTEATRRHHLALKQGAKQGYHFNISK